VRAFADRGHWQKGTGRCGHAGRACVRSWGSSRVSREGSRGNAVGGAGGLGSGRAATPHGAAAHGKHVNRHSRCGQGHVSSATHDCGLGQLRRAAISLRGTCGLFCTQFALRAGLVMRLSGLRTLVVVISASVEVYMRVVAIEYLSLDGVFEEPGNGSGAFFNDEAGSSSGPSCRQATHCCSGQRPTRASSPRGPSKTDDVGFGGHGAGVGRPARRQGGRPRPIDRLPGG
jgi:hypothetical protein